MYSSLVLKLAPNLHPSDRILQGSYDCMSPDRSWQVTDLQMYPVCCLRSQHCKRRKETNISSPNCISTFISIMKERIKNFRERSLTAVHL